MGAERTFLVLLGMTVGAGCGGSENGASSARPSCSVDAAISGDFAAAFARDYPCPLGYVTGADPGATSVYLPQDDFDYVPDAAPTTSAFVSVRLFGLHMEALGKVPAGVQIQPRQEGIPQLWTAGWETGADCLATIESVEDVQSNEGLVAASVTCSAPLVYSGQESSLDHLHFRAVFNKQALSTR